VSRTLIGTDATALAVAIVNTDFRFRCFINTDQASRAERCTNATADAFRSIHDRLPTSLGPGVSRRKLQCARAQKITLFGLPDMLLLLL